MIDPDLSVVILAAGSSNRLGQPKQLLNFKNSTLLEYTVKCALSISPNVFVVLGSNSKLMEAVLGEYSINTSTNPQWSIGIGSSIAFGTKKVQKSNSSTNSILFLLSDQPFISTELLSKLTRKHRQGDKSITACNYGSIIGVPAIFGNEHFHELSKLSGDKGAKALIKHHLEQVHLIDFPQGKIDIDRKEDLRFLE